MPSEARSSRPACLSSRRSTTRSPWPEGSVETRTSTARPAIRRLMRPSCGRRFSAMSSRDITLMREMSSGATRALGLQHLAQHAVDAEADHEPVLVGLDVDVGSVFLDRLCQHGIDQADDRGVVLALHEVGRLRQALGKPREVGFALDALDDLPGLAAAAFVGLAQQLVERRFARRARSRAECRGTGGVRRPRRACAPSR